MLLTIFLSFCTWKSVWLHIKSLTHFISLNILDEKWKLHFSGHKTQNQSQDTIWFFFPLHIVSDLIYSRKVSLDYRFNIYSVLFLWVSSLRMPTICTVDLLCLLSTYVPISWILFSPLLFYLKHFLLSTFT